MKIKQVILLKQTTKRGRKKNKTGTATPVLSLTSSSQIPTSSHLAKNVTGLSPVHHCHPA